MKRIRCLTVLAGLLALNGLGQTNLPTFSSPAAGAAWMAAARSELQAARSNALRALPATDRRSLALAGDSLRQASGPMQPLDRSPQCVSRPAGLVAWWRAGGDAVDCVGSNQGELLNGVGFGNGMVWRAFALDGLDDGVSVADAPALDFGAGQNFSIEAWIQPLASDTYYGVMDIVDKRQAMSWSQDVGYER